LYLLSNSTTSEDVNPKHSEKFKSRMFNSNRLLRPEKKPVSYNLLVPVNETYKIDSSFFRHANNYAKHLPT